MPHTGCLKLHCYLQDTLSIQAFPTSIATMLVTVQHKVSCIISNFSMAYA
jgi:hypothetical protein